MPRGVDGSVWCLRTKNVQAELDLSDVWAIDASFVKRSEQYLQAGDLLVSSANSWNLIGKCSWIPELESDATFGGFVTVLRGNPQLVDRRYLYQWFSSSRTQAVVRSFSRQTTNIANLDLRRCSELAIPLPSLAQQKRIAAVLDTVDALRAKRREAIALLDDLAQSVFLDMFGNLVEVSKNVPLSSVANIASGITKGRKEPCGELQNVPYLTVANVQDRELKLSTVKEIAVSVAELERFRLRSEDLLLTEGGDPDKLGRGTLWREELPVCIHQNHVFRVRVMDREEIDPVYLNWVMSSSYGKSYFLRTAKQTTGIASINKTQLGAFPLPVSPIVRQREFRSRIERVQEHQQEHRTHLATLDELFTSLQHRAFSGTLWDHEASGEAA